MEEKNSNDPKNLGQMKILGINRNLLLLIILVLIWVAIVAIFYGPRITTYFGVLPIAPEGQAHLGIFPATGAFQQDDTFQSEVRVDTAQRDVVAVRAIVKFDSSVFQATGIDASGSAFNYEVESEIDNANGEIRITRGQPTPGINNSNALVAVINFTVNSTAAAGQSTISFGSTTQAPAGNSDVIADDGSCPIDGSVCSGATDLLTDDRTHSATYTIEAAAYDPDVTNDGSVDFDDLSQFVSWYRSQDPQANVDTANPAIDFNDLSAYVSLYRAAQ